MSEDGGRELKIDLRSACKVQPHSCTISRQSILGVGLSPDSVLEEKLQSADMSHFLIEKRREISLHLVICYVKGVFRAVSRRWEL